MTRAEELSAVLALLPAARAAGVTQLRVGDIEVHLGAPPPPPPAEQPKDPRTDAERRADEETADKVELYTNLLNRPVTREEAARLP